MPAIIKILILMCYCLLRSIHAAQDIPNGVTILKHINRVNDDGSYTFGYEADDGSFKIETRDVQGNVKGMFGYIDETGELKRVSYSANNGTGYEPMTTPTPVSEENDEDSRDEEEERENDDEDDDDSNGDNDKPDEKDESSQRRGPVLVLGQQVTSTRAPVIQHIPRKTSSEDNSRSSTTPAYGEYIGGRKPSMDLFIRAVASADTNLHRARDRIDQIHPRTTPAPVRRILVNRRPVSEDPHHRESANLIRRQLGSEQASRPIDTHHVYPEDERSRYIAPQARIQSQVLASLLPQTAPEYRNQILSQNARGFGPISVVDPTLGPGFERPEDPVQVTTIPPTPFPTRNGYYPENAVIPQRRFRPQTGLDGNRFSLPIGDERQARYDRPPLTTQAPQISPILQRRPFYAESPTDFNRGQSHEQVSAIQSLKDELMEYLLQYLQQRTSRFNPGFQSRYPSPIPPSLPTVPNQYYNPGSYYPPYNQYPIPNPQYYGPMMYNQYAGPSQFSPLPNQNQPYFNPYFNQNFQYPNPVSPNAGQYPQIPIGQPFPIGLAPSFSNQAQLNNPNIQHSGQQSQQSQQVNPQILTSASAAPRLADSRTISPTPFLRTFRPTPLPQQDLSQQEQIFRTLVAASTRAPSSPAYDSSPTTELPKRSTQPIRNVQIIGSASETVTQRIASQSTTEEVESTARASTSQKIGN